jgi:hypothetical protein
MKICSTAIVAILLVLSVTGGVYAGVVVNEQQVIDSGDGHTTTQNVILMIQGNKQKTQIGDNTMVLDLDKGTRTIMSSAQHAYIQMPFPPNRAPIANMNPMAFKKTGTTDKVVGYSCEEYTGSATMGGNQSSLKACFSTVAPGASEFTAFNKKMADKVKGTPLAMMAGMPAGVPMRLDTTTKITHVSMPGMTSDQMAKVNDMLAKRPPTVTHMTVTKIAVKDLPSDTFSVPSGYTRQELGQGAGRGAGAPPAGAATPGTKVPE